MFAKTFYLSLILLLWVIVFAGYQFCYVREGDLEKCRESSAAAQSAKSAPSSIHQKRNGVSKDIWLAEKGGGRTHHRIESQTSTLSLLPERHTVEVIENLQGIRAFMQDKVYFDKGIPMQQVRHLEADTGIYSYRLQTLIAKSVHIQLFHMQDHVLPETFLGARPFLNGMAEDILFSIEGNRSHFTAKHFTAHFAKQ